MRSSSQGKGIQVQFTVTISAIEPQELQFDPHPKSGANRMLIGRGGFGAVYAGRYQGQPVAIKTLHVTTAKVVKSLYEEAAVMFRLASPYTVKLQGICSDESETSLVMERMMGGSLFHLLQDESQELPWALRYRLAYEIAEGLGVLHAQGIIHRDLKSLNVLLDEAHHAKITDFGFSKLRGQVTSIALSSHKASLGTLAYKSPELMEADSDSDDEAASMAMPVKKAVPYSSYSDIYAYGMILWELATRCIPFEEMSQRKIEKMIKKGKQLPIPVDCPVEFAALIKACWTMEPGQRPRTDQIVAQTKAWYESTLPVEVADEKAESEFDVEVPPTYKCPITLEMMRDPVVLLDDAQTYEREAIEGYLRQSRRPLDPETRKPLVIKKIQSNLTLKKAIQAFIQNHSLHAFNEQADGWQSAKKITVDLDACIAAELEREQDEIEQAKLRRKSPLESYQKNLKNYLQQRHLLNQHTKEYDYDVFISYAWEDKYNLQSHQKLQRFLKRLHDDLQAIGLKVFLDIHDMRRDMREAMIASIEQSGIVLSICKPFLKEAIEKAPQGNIALEINRLLQRMQQHPHVFLPLLCEGEQATAVPRPVQKALSAQQLDGVLQDIRPVFSEFDPHNQFSEAYMIWFTHRLVPRVLANLGMKPEEDLLLKTLTQVFHNQVKQQQLPQIHQMSQWEQFHYNQPKLTQEAYARQQSQAFEFFLRRLQELSTYRKDIAMARSVLLVYQKEPGFNPRGQALEQWIEQFARHLTLSGIEVNMWAGGDGQLPNPLPLSIIMVCTPYLKQTMDRALQRPRSVWRQLQHHLAQRDVVCCPMVYEGTYSTAVPKWSLEYPHWEKSLFVRNTKGHALTIPHTHYLDVMVKSEESKGLLLDLLNYEDNDACYLWLLQALQQMLFGWGTRDLLALEESVLQGRAEEQEKAAQRNKAAAEEDKEADTEGRIKVYSHFWKPAKTTPPNVSAFLRLVAEGEQDKAEAMLKANPHLGVATGSVTDLSKRTFQNITALQYALWALDWNMWLMLLKYIPREEAQLQAMALDENGTEHGKHFDFSPLLNAYQTYEQNYSAWYKANNWEAMEIHWCKQVGGAQLLLPAHAINEYCRPDRAFYPVPNFNQEGLPRVREVNGKAGSDVYTHHINGGALGEKWGLARGIQLGACGPFITTFFLSSSDAKAVKALSEARLQHQ
ncbi:MAG: hypothetical protein K0R24_1469, partial [Gammaproteobacteria bacterium]|nr:hypothetical protein [Gammaproteobacteria bacterium]